MGELLIHAASFPSPENEMYFQSELDRKLIRIWPPMYSEISWPIPVILSDEDAYSVSNYFTHSLFQRALKIKNI